MERMKISFQKLYCNCPKIYCVLNGFFLVVSSSKKERVIKSNRKSSILTKAT